MKQKLTAEEKLARKRLAKVLLMLRSAWSKDPRRAEAFKKSRRKYVGENKRQKFEYQCYKCKKWFKKEMKGRRCVNLQVDHVDPCGGTVYFDKVPHFVKSIGWHVYRLFWGELKIVCKPCHKIKTKLDLTLIKERRKQQIEEAND